MPSLDCYDPIYLKEKVVLLSTKKVDTLRSGREIKHIVAALDVSANSDKTMDEAISLAKYYDAKITGIHVIGIQPTLSNGEINPSEGNKAEKIMLSIKKDCEEKGIQFAFDIPYGKPSSEIAKFAEK